MQNPVDNYPAVMRHYQFSDGYNGSWYIEILGAGRPQLFIVQEVRNGAIVRRSSEPKSFGECQKVYWARAHKMSLEAGFESAPPPMPTDVEWERG